jgi:hypothetical protein
MKRYFVGWTAVGLFLVMAGVARGQTVNLDLTVDGPFAVCENITNHTLTIFIPNLDGGVTKPPFPSYKHFIPGISTNSSNLPLVSGSIYPPYKSGTTDYKLTTGEDPGSMKLKPSGNTVFLYHEKYVGDCTKVLTTGASISLNVPNPDEVWPLETDQVFTYVKDAKTGGFLGPSQCGNTTTGCRYASKVVLRFLDVDQAKVSVSVGGSSVWTPVHPVVMGSEYEMTLDVVPDPNASGKNSQQAIDSFARAGGMFNSLLSKQPVLGVVTPIDDALSPPADSSKVYSSPWSVVSHAACHVPIIFYCQSGSACQ